MAQNVTGYAIHNCNGKFFEYLPHQAPKVITLLNFRSKLALFWQWWERFSKAKTIFFRDFWKGKLCNSCKNNAPSREL